MAASSDFERILVKDDRIGCITDKIKYGVLKGGQNVTSQTFNAISKSSSAHVFNIAVPSLETIISREVLWKSSFTLRIETDATVKRDHFPYFYMVNYGVTDALAPFPLHQLVNTMTATINNNSVSVNVQDVLPAILRLADPDELALYDATTPTALDYLANYRDGIDLLEYQILAGGQTGAIGGTTTTFRPVVMIPGVDASPATTGAGNAAANANTFQGTATQKFISYPNNVLSYDKQRPAAGDRERTPRGSFIIKRISTAADYVAGLDFDHSTIPKVDSTVVYVDVEVTEPLLISPFIFGSPDEKAGFYGITNMNFQMNMASNANRAWRSMKFKNSTGARSFIKNAYIQKVADSSLTFTFITGHPTDQLPSRNIVPYYELPIYRTAGPMLIPKRSLVVDNGGAFSTPATYEVKSNNIQLNMIPDKLIVFCKRLNMTTGDADAFLTITNVNINFNNNAGLLSNMTQEQLYKASVASGLKNMSWQEFSGLTVSTSNIYYNDNVAESRSGFSGVGAYSVIGSAEDQATHRTPGFQLTPTVGTMLCLNFAEVIQLTEDYYAPGSLGSFNLQISIKVQNHQIEDWVDGQWEMIVIPMNSGIFVNERGTSSVYTALLTKADVLDASEQEHYSHGTIKRMIGGSLLSNLKSAMSWISSKLPFVKNILGKIDHPYARAGHDVLKAVGYGRSGGGTTGGGLQNRLVQK